MSTETFLTGGITLKKGVGYDEARKLAESISEYTEVSEIPAGWVSYEYYMSNLRQKINGQALILWSEHDEAFDIRYSNVSWSSHIYEEKIADLRKALYQRREIIKTVHLSLFYLTEPDEGIYIDSEDKDKKGWDWTDEDKEPPTD
jgi:hypothetical protein